MITLEQALTANEFWHATQATANLRLDDCKPGTPPVKCRRNGATKTWKTKPGLFRIPVKYGLKSYFYIQNFDDLDAGAPASTTITHSRNNHSWCVPELWEAERHLFPTTS